MTGSAARSARGHRQQPLGDLACTSSTASREWWIARRVVRRQAQRDRGDRGDRCRPARPGCAPRRAARPRAAIAAPPRCRRAPRRSAPGVGGSDRRGAARSSARSRCRPSRAALDRRRRRARTRSSRRRCPRPGTASPGRAPTSSRVAPAKESSASSSPVTTSGSTPSMSRDAGDELVPVLGVPGGARWPRTATAVGARARAIDLGVLAAGGEGALQRLGGEPAGAVDALAEPDDLASAGRASMSVAGRGSTSATSSRIELVPQSMAATRVTAPSTARTHGPLRHHSGSSASASSPSGFTPGPGRQRVADQHVQALHPVRHAAGAGRRDLGHARSASRRREVVLVRGRGRRRPAPGRRPAGPSSPSSRPRPPACRSRDAARGQVR